jgi:uncharacterized membrane protein YfcA
MDAIQLLVVSLIALFASTVNGGLGYGYSSISVPLLLFMYTNKQINPYLNIIESILNPYVLLSNRRGINRKVIITVVPIVLGLVPGVTLGVYLLNMLDPKTLKAIFYSILLPLILLQAAGLRWPLPERLLYRGIGQVFGFGIGLLYSLTTISGPPLALLFNNQGFVKEEFRASLGIIRTIESWATLIGYIVTGLTNFNVIYNPLFLSFIIPLVPGIKLGEYIIRRIVRPETFRRITMSFDAWIVGLGLSRNVSLELGLMTWQYAQFIWYIAIGIDLILLYRYFNKK